jgi:hypothetical protein
MNVQGQAVPRDNVFKRLLLVYGLYTLISNAMFLVGYYLLPEASCAAVRRCRLRAPSQAACSGRNLE